MCAMARMESTVTLVDNSVNGTLFLDSSTDNPTTSTLYENYEESNEYLDYVKYSGIIVPIGYGLVSVIGLAGNILTVAVVLLNKMKGIADILIMSLAAADLLVIVVGVSFEVIRVTMLPWPFGDVWCGIHVYLIFACACASSYILILISLDRYLALVHPIRAASWRTRRNCYIALIIVWSISLLGNIPYIPTREDLGEGRFHCVASVSRIFVVYVVLLGFVFPFTLISILYGHMMKVFLTGNIPGLNSHIENSRLQSRKRITKMAIIVMMLFVICWLPFQIILLYVVFVNDSEIIIKSLLEATNCFSYLNNCLHPILYSFYLQTFRKRFKDMLCCKKTIVYIDNVAAVTRQ